MHRLLGAFVWVIAALGPRASWAQDYVGADVCKTCHEHEYQHWRTTGHAMALARLSATQQRDRVCRSCHTMDPTKIEAPLAGVQCESCHGPGGYYQQRYVMKDAVLSRLLGLTEAKHEMCVKCHADDGPSATPFSFAEALKRVAHPRPEPAVSTREDSGPPPAEGLATRE